MGLPVEPVLAICEQDEDGFLHLSLTIQSSHSSMVSKVKFCPFCGFKPEKVESASTAEIGTME